MRRIIVITRAVLEQFVIFIGVILFLTREQLTRSSPTRRQTILDQSQHLAWPPGPRRRPSKVSLGWWHHGRRHRVQVADDPAVSKQAALHRSERRLHQADLMPLLGRRIEVTEVCSTSRLSESCKTATAATTSRLSAGIRARAKPREIVARHAAGQGFLESRTAP